MNKINLFALLLLILTTFLLISCENSPAEEISQQMRGWAYRNNVSVLRQTQDRNLSQKLASPDVFDLNVDDMVTVDDNGLARLAISDSLVVELFRDGELQIQEASLDEQSMLVTLAMNSGAVFNELNVEDAINAKLQIKGNYASVTATGTQFLVVKEQFTPLEWVIALDATGADLVVEADGSSIVLPTGKATWVAPDGPPGPIVDANMTAVINWLTQARGGTSQPEFGEVVWAPAALNVNAAEFPADLPLEQPFEVHQIIIRLDPEGSYEHRDCNGDGMLDLYSSNGRFQFDLRQIIGQKRAIDVRIINGFENLEATLTGLNPANEQISVSNTADNAAGEVTLSLRSDVQPYHFAELSIADGCLIGLELKNIEGSESPPTNTPGPITSTPTATATSTATATFIPPPTICVPSPPAGWVQHTVTTGDTMYNMAARTGVFISTIKDVNCYFSDQIFLGQLLWLPFNPPTVTPTITPTATPTNTPTATPTATPTNTPIPRAEVCEILIQSVNPTQFVTFTTVNFPANQTYYVTMESALAQYNDAITVGTIDSGNGGNLTITMNIPDQLMTTPEITIRVRRDGTEFYCGSATFINGDLYDGPGPIK